MIETDCNGIKFFKFNKLKKISHGISTRAGGISKEKFSSLNLSYKVEDLNNNIQENRRRVAACFSLEVSSIFYPDQCHSSYVREVHQGSEEKDLLYSDALITNKKDIALAVLAADCVPILLYDPIGQAIAVAHAGWKGTAGRIVARTVEQLVKKYKTKPENIIAGIGPCISQEIYEVGDEVAEKFRFWFADAPEICRKNNASGKTHINLKEANRQLLLRYGVLSDNIEVCEYCTYGHPEWFFSARRDGFQCGRFASIISLKN